MSMDEVFASMRAQRNFKQGIPATSADIERIESSLSIVLPNSYHLFLKQFGYCRWFGRSVYGFFQPPDGAAIPKDFDTLRVTLRAREEKLPQGIASVPRDGNVLARFDAGGYYFLFSQESRDGGAVVLIDHAQGGSVVQTWGTFEEYLRWLVTL